jgi:hypothetical protein
MMTSELFHMYDAGGQLIAVLIIQGIYLDERKLGGAT